MNTNHLFFFIKLKITAPNSSSSLCKQRQNINSLLLHIKDRNYRVLKFILSWQKKKKERKANVGSFSPLASSLLLSSFSCSAFLFIVHDMRALIKSVSSHWYSKWTTT